MVTLFDSLVREDWLPADRAEPHFEFLNRAASPYWGAVRLVLEQWFGRYPIDDRERLRTSFRSNDDRQYLSAFWELYLHELFSRMGFNVEIHPNLEDRARKPDFIVRRGRQAAYVEARTVTLGVNLVRAELRRDRILDAIDQYVRSDAFVVAVNFLHEGNNDPSTTKIVHDLGKWLDSLNPYDVRYEPQFLTNPKSVKKILRYGQWVLEIRPISRASLNFTLRHRTVLMSGPSEGMVVADYLPIRDRIKRKASRYGSLDAPYVIALLCSRWTADGYDIRRALFGIDDGNPETLRSGRLSTPFLRRPEFEGVWVKSGGPQGTRVSAILSSLHTSPLSIQRELPHIWHNPWARLPLEMDFPLGSTRVDLASGQFVSTEPRTSAHALFELPEKWPPGEPFPEVENV